MTKHRVLCCGGRNFSNRQLVFESLDLLRSKLGDFAVIQGGARGADDLSLSWGKSNGLPVITVEANWIFWDKRAGPIRNSWMIEFCFPTYGVAFPGGIGTQDMIRKLEASSIPVWKL